MFLYSTTLFTLFTNSRIKNFLPHLAFHLSLFLESRDPLKYRIRKILLINKIAWHVNPLIQLINVYIYICDNEEYMRMKISKYHNSQRGDRPAGHLSYIYIYIYIIYIYIYLYISIYIYVYIYIYRRSKSAESRNKFRCCLSVCLNDVLWSPFRANAQSKSWT